MSQPETPPSAIAESEIADAIDDAERMIGTCEITTGLVKGHHTYDTAWLLRICKALVALGTRSQSGEPETVHSAAASVLHSVVKRCTDQDGSWTAVSTVALDLLQQAVERADCAPSSRREIKLVRQKEANGCVVASLAMLTGRTYEQVRADHIFSALEGEAKGCSFREAEEYLWRHGYAWQEVYRCGPPGNTMKGVWPPEPWADAHICEVRTEQAHAVVLLGDGSVLDPLTDEPKRLTDYAEVYSVRAVYRIPSLKNAPLSELEAANSLASATAFGKCAHCGSEERLCKWTEDHFKPAPCMRRADRTGS